MRSPTRRSRSSQKTVRGGSRFWKPHFERLEDRTLLSAGDLDLPFGIGGKVISNFGAFDFASATAVLDDGKILAAGGSDGDFLAARYGQDGTLDTTFGEADAGNPGQRTGRVRIDLGGTGTNFPSGIVEFAEDMAVQADGKIVLAGRTDARAGTLQFGVARINADGTLDTTFGNNGTVVTDVFGRFSRATGVAIQPDGKIVVVGTADLSATSWSFALVRYDTHGNLDTTFGLGGIVATNFNNSVAHRVAIQTDGKIVVAGYANVGGHFGFALARYLPEDGSLDPSFDHDGKVTTAASYFGFFDAVPYDVDIQPDGKILIGGNAGRTATSDNSSDFVLARYNSDGSLDLAFNHDGIVTTNFAGQTEQAYRIALQPDGKIVSAGWAGSDFALARHNGDGSLDDGGPLDSTPIDSFGAGGKVTTDFGAAYDAAGGLALQSDGKIVVAGRATIGGNNDFALARYEGDPTNMPPHANAGGPYTVEEGSTLGLDGSGSTDDHPIPPTGYQWDLDADGVFGETGTAASRGEEVGIAPTFSAAGLDGPSSVTVSLLVTDDGGLTSSDTAVINVAPQPPFTVITHGFSPLGGLAGLPAWTLKVRDEIESRRGDEAESVVVDWLAESNNASPGWTEAAGDETFARIMWQLQRGTPQDSPPIDVHFIGHSRGTVVNSEANERLAYYEAAFPAIGEAVDEVQVTMLDAHPANNTAGASGTPGSLLLDALFEFATQDPGPVIWNNVTWADAYFQRSNFLTCLGFETLIGLNLHGLDFDPNVFSKELTHQLPGDDGLCHGDFGDWYKATITGTIPNQGYFHSLAEAGWDQRPDPQSPVGTAPSAPLRVFNGGFDYRGSEDHIPGWVGENFGVVSGELRLKTSKSLSALITHNPLFVAPNIRSLEFNVERIGPHQNGTLSVYFVPAQDLPDSNGELVPGTPRLLHSWSLGQLSPGLKRLPLGLAESELGQVGGLQFLLSSSDGKKKEVRIDDVTLSTSTGAILAVTQANRRPGNRSLVNASPSGSRATPIDARSIVVTGIPEQPVATAIGHPPVATIDVVIEVLLRNRNKRHGFGLSPTSELFAAELVSLLAAT